MAAGDGSDGKKLSAPKFSSFKPKLPSREQSEKPSSRESAREGDDSRPARRHRHHRSSHDRDNTPRRHEGRTATSRSDYQRDEKSLESLQKPGKAPQERPGTGVSGVFIIDTKGDPLIRKYGLDRSKIPAFRRYGRGRVLGTDGRLVVHYDGPRETVSLVFPGEGGPSRTKDGLRSTGWQKRQPVRLRAAKGGPEANDPGDYISLESSRKRKRHDDEDSSDDDQPVWRSIEGKAKAGQTSTTEPDGDESESSTEEIDEPDRDDALKWKSIQLNRRVKEHPSDIDSWMELVYHQDDLLNVGGTTDGRAADNAARSFSEIKLSMLESALPHAAGREDRERVLAALMFEGCKVWNSKTAAKKWADITEDDMDSFILWKTHLDFAMSDIATVQYDGMKMMLLDRIQRVIAKCGLNAKEDILEAIYVFLRATRFIHDSGYRELAVAAWQALIELNLFRPHQTQDQTEALAMLEEFWESEVARIGDPEAQGWKHFVNSGGNEDPPEAVTPDEAGDKTSSKDAYKAWGILEHSQERKAKMPARTLDDGTDDDPFRVVMFSDIEPLLFQIPDSFLYQVYEELIDALLLFCGLPPAFDMTSWTDLAQDDQFLAAAGTDLDLQPAWETGEEGEELQRKPPRFASGLCRARSSADLLFGGSSWFQLVDRAGTDSSIDMAWVQTLLKQLIHSQSMPQLAAYYLGVCFAREPAAIRKTAKAVLKKYPNEAELYNAYALAEYANGNVDVAIKVLSSATSLTTFEPASTASSLYKTWSWIELERAHKVAAAKRLCACVDESLRQPQLDDEPISRTTILKARQVLTGYAETCLYQGNVRQASVHFECLIMLSYLTGAEGSEPASASQGNISSAMDTSEGLSKELISSRRSPKMHELMLQFASRLLYWHASKGPFRRVFMREKLSRFIDLFPRNTIFLTLLEWADASIQVIDETRQVLDDRVLVKKQDCVSSRVFAIQHELARGNAHSTRAAFERAFRSDVCKSSVVIWKAYLRFTHSQRKRLRQAAKEGFYRALKHCPWDKSLMMEAFGTLIRDMKSEELRSVYSTMTSKGMRVHVDMEEYMDRRHLPLRTVRQLRWLRRPPPTGVHDMAHVDQPLESLRQAGGGASETQRGVKTLGEHTIPYLRRIFESHAGPDKTWTAAQVKTFMQRVQDNDDATPAAAHLLGQPDIDFNGFLAYMTSTDSAITIPWQRCDLSWPLASYYISSSHNTYLSGNQLSSDSTTAAYTNVLLRGCRCVEIDVWDGDESDAESSASSNSEAEHNDAIKAKKPKTKSKKSKFSMFKDKLPDSLSAKLEKTSLGKKLEDKDAAKHGAAAAKGHKAAGEVGPVEQPEVAMIEPRVLHGYTLTKEVSFRDVCIAIRESAFAVTDLPLIISLEVHCNAEQQTAMVKIMKEVWQGLLVAEPETPAQLLPTPDQLRGKILIKVKHVPADAAAVPETSDSGEDDRAPNNKAVQPKKVPKIIQELSRLGVYTQAVSFKDWTQPEAANPMHIFSLSENKFLDHHEKFGKDLFDHNKQYLMRAYPSGLRISSSNLNPPVFWGSGAQIVALNWQQADEGMMLNEGMFAGTGGYVLKPEGFRPNIESKPPHSTTSPRKALSLHITFLAAQSIPLPNDNTTAKGFKPYIKTEIHVDASHLSPLNDGHGHESEFKERTRTHRGCDVDFAGEKVSFSGIGGLIEELTFVRFTVRDDEIGRDDLAAWACVRLDRLGQGYRFIHLMDDKGKLTDGVVLVKVEKTLT
ncbi:DUF1740-domain-containing protein [Purpureocillium lavendulum]|uniref:1-phosphatidylinositol 4,5-bisphosphate phosphodiesterase 1 n=1 Tax=Purpureocillium lavendulum TaxID=1247861 RepID=A0AB34G8Y0_9HYPO|nr:DUF1740-domain-containing protein [Purpureocillium lavendulum]